MTTPDEQALDAAALIDALDQAAAEHALDVEVLGGMHDDELTYLASVEEFDDPVTDGIECASHMRTD
jgi:hypothetical protein